MYRQPCVGQVIAFPPKSFSFLPKPKFCPRVSGDPSSKDPSGSLLWIRVTRIPQQGTARVKLTIIGYKTHTLQKLCGHEDPKKSVILLTAGAVFAPVS